MSKPEIISGNIFQDYRGKVSFNNDFDASAVKRIYFIENADTSTIRAWQGHRVERRWFSTIAGSFLIKLIQVENWDTPDPDSPVKDYILNADDFSVLHIPAGFISYIQALEEGSKLMVMADYSLGEIKDEYRYPADYFQL